VPARIVGTRGRMDNDVPGDCGASGTGKMRFRAYRDGAAVLVRSGTVSPMIPRQRCALPRKGGTVAGGGGGDGSVWVPGPLAGASGLLWQSGRYLKNSSASVMNSRSRVRIVPTASYRGAVTIFRPRRATMRPKFFSMTRRAA
jgi:hypothetical protein